MHFSLSSFLKGFYVEQDKWEYTQRDREYYVFGALVSWRNSLLNWLAIVYYFSSNKMLIGYKKKCMLIIYASK